MLFGFIPGLGGQEMLLLLVLGILLFGRKLPEIGRSLGKTMVEFKKGMRGAHSGTKNYRTGKKRSAGGEYPANDSGALERSIKVQERSTDVTIGTNTFYARFLRDGTRKMARRKMSDNALDEGIKTARHELKGFVKWKR